MFPPGVWFADVMLSFFGVTFVLFLFRFRQLLLQKPRSPIVSRYACAPTATRSNVTIVCVLIHVVLIFLLGRCRFFRVFSAILLLPFFMESTLYVLLPVVGVFYLVTKGWIFLTSY